MLTGVWEMRFRSKIINVNKSVSDSVVEAARLACADFVARSA